MVPRDIVLQIIPTLQDVRGREGWKNGEEPRKKSTVNAQLLQGRCAEWWAAEKLRQDGYRVRGPWFKRNERTGPDLCVLINGEWKHVEVKSDCKNTIKNAEMSVLHAGIIVQVCRNGIIQYPLWDRNHEKHQRCMDELLCVVCMAEKDGGYVCKAYENMWLRPMRSLMSHIVAPRSKHLYLRKAAIRGRKGDGSYIKEIYKLVQRRDPMWRHKKAERRFERAKQRLIQMKSNMKEEETFTPKTQNRFAALKRDD